MAQQIKKPVASKKSGNKAKRNKGLFISITAILLAVLLLFSFVFFFVPAKKSAKDKEPAAMAMQDKNLVAGNKYLEENKKNSDVKVTGTGLQYRVMTEGTGTVPVATDKVRVHYRGTLIDGTEFDSSYKRGEPLEFPVGGVIKGWQEALTMMPVGSKWILYIPQQLAYGGRQTGNIIKPYSALIFEIELLDIVK